MYTYTYIHIYLYVYIYIHHSGDFGLRFFGNELESGAYLVQHPTLGDKGLNTNTNLSRCVYQYMYLYLYYIYIDHSGDFGLGFFGNALESGAYLVQHPTLGSKDIFEITGISLIYVCIYIYMCVCVCVTLAISAWVRIWGVLGPAPNAR